MRVGWLALVVIGCGDNTPDPADGAHSGERLRIPWYAFDAGPRHWVRQDIYRDVLRDEDCAPRAWSDGNTYCTPANAMFGSQVVYRDAGCTKPASRAAAPYFAEGDGNGCDPHVQHLYKLGSPEQTSAYWIVDPTGACARTDNIGGELYPFVEEVPAGALVALSIDVPPGSDRVKVRYRVSADGLQMPIGFRDAEIGDAVQFGIEVYPEHAFYLGDAMYPDAQCLYPEAMVTRDCPVPAIADDGAHYYHIGARVNEPPAYVEFSGQCVAGSPNVPDPTFYAIGSEVQLAWLTASHDDVPGDRLQLYHSTMLDPADGHLHYPSPIIYDAQLDLDCDGTTLTDGTAACLPDVPNAHPATLYNDGNCMYPIEVVMVDLLPFSPSPSYVVARIDADPGYQVREVGDPVTTPTYMLDGSTCHMYAEQLALFAQGPVVPLDRFAHGRIVIDD